MTHHDLRPRKRQVPWIVRTVGGRFAYLLVAMIALMLAVPLLSYGPMWGILITVSTSAVLVACLHATRPGRGAIRFGLCLAISDVLLGRLVAFEGLKWLLLVQSLLWIVTLSYVIAKVLEAVFERNRVDAQTLQAALCIYLLLGYVWVYLYGLIDVANPDSFRFAGGVGRGWSDENARLVLFSKLFVYSFAKLTSSGYLDVTPNTSFTNICGSLEAMMGQVFLAVVIARLVGLQILEAGSSEAAEIDKTVESIEFDRAESRS